MLLFGHWSAVSCNPQDLLHITQAERLHVSSLRLFVRACVCGCVYACQFAGNAAATAPAVAEGSLAVSAPLSTIMRLRSGSRPAPCCHPRSACWAYGGGISRPAHSVSVCALTVLRGGARRPRSPVRRRARHPSAPAAHGAWSEYLPSRRASACAASGASRRPGSLRLVSPPLESR